MSELPSLHIPVPHPDRGVKKVFVGVGKAVQSRYETHKKHYIEKRVVPGLEGLPKEIQDVLHSGLEKTAHRVAVGRTTAEIVGVSAALVGTVLLIRNKFSKRGMPVGMPEQLSSAIPIPTDQPIRLEDFPFTSRVDTDLVDRVGMVVRGYDEAIARQHPTLRPIQRNLGVFHGLVHDFYKKRPDVDIVDGLNRIQKKRDNPGWIGDLGKVLGAHFDRIFAYRKSQLPAEIYVSQRNSVVSTITVIEAMNYDKSLSGFLDSVWLRDRLLKKS